MMRSLVFRSLCLVLLVSAAACGGNKPTSQGPGPNGDGSGSAGPDTGPRDTRTELEKRRDTACDTLGPRMTACAVEEAKASHAAGKITKQQLDADTSADVQARNTAEFLKQCKVPMSTRQVRVLEVCPAEETECGPMLSCLEHLNDKPK